MNNLPFTGRPDFGFWLSFEDPNDPATTPVWIDFTASWRAAGALSRGAQYELGQTLAADPTVILRDVQEFLNSANPTSPYFTLVDSYRRVLLMGTWPNTTAGNLFNANYWGIAGTVDANLGPRDPSFESYALGTATQWIAPIGGINPVVGNVTPNSGTQDLTYTVVGSTSQQGIAFNMRCMPGRYYTISLYMRQSSASLQRLQVDASLGTTTTTTGAYVRMTKTFLATSFEPAVFMCTSGTAIAGTVLIDDIQMEQAPPLNRTSTGDSNISMAQGAAGWTPHGCTIVRSNAHAYQPEYSLAMTPDGVSTTPYFESDRASSPAVPGQQYIASGRAYSFAGSNVPFLADVRVNWYNASNVLIANPTGTPTALTANQWTFITTTFTAPVGAAFVTVLATVVGTPPASDVVFWDLVQVVSTTPSAFTTAGPAVYPIMNNFAERFEKLWLDGEYTGYVQIPCVDALVPLASTRIGTEYAVAVAASTPSFSYPLSASNAAGTNYLDTSGNNFPPLAPYVSKYGPGTALAASSISIVGDPGAMAVGFTNTNTSLTVGNTGTILGNGYINRQAAGGGTWNWPPLASTWSASLSAWITCQPVTVPSADLQQIAQAVLPGNGVNGSTPIALAVATNGQAMVGSGGPVTWCAAQAGPLVNDGKPHHIVGTVTQVSGGNTVLDLYVDGVHVGTGTVTTASLGGVLVTTAASFMVGGQFAYQSYKQILSGSAAWVIGWPRALSAADVTALWTAGGLGQAGETAGTRVARHFAIGNYPAPYRISRNTTSIMGPPSYVGSIDLGSDTANSAVAEGGHFWIAPDGAPVLESRLDRWLRLSPLWTVGNTAGLTHFGSPSYSVDPQFVYANVQLTRSGGSTATGGSPADIGVATRRYFGRTYSAPGALDLSTDTQTQDLANFTFYTHNRTFQRIAVLTFYPYADLSWAFALGVEVGNRMRVNFSTPAANGGGGFTNNADFFVENVTHDQIDADAATWAVSLLLSPIGGPAPPTLQPFILNSATLGVLNSNILGW